jgi:hypothetical protein
VLGGTPRADFEVPEGLDPLLTLALGMRAGYPGKPLLPLGREVEGTAERLPHQYVRLRAVDHAGPCYPAAWRPDHRLEAYAGRADADRQGAAACPVAVIGSTAEDFALAVALD